MKKIFITILISASLISCRKVPLIEVPNPPVPNLLEITSASGLRLESPFVTSEVAINVKLEKEGSVVIKIMDISNKTVSKEELYVKQGDNILKVYTNALPPSAYRIGLYDIYGKLIGITDFNKL